MTLNIQKMLVLSIGHLTEETGKVLNATDAVSVSWGPQLSWEYGWIWWVDRNTLTCVDFPEEFAAIFKIALANGCNWVRFDEDGEKIASLPYHEW